MRMSPRQFPRAIPVEGEAKKIIGSYSLVDTNFPPEIREMRGPAPFGMIVYDPNGYMTVQIAPGREYEVPKKFPLTPEESHHALPGFVSYFGTYTVDWDNQTVSHHRIFMMPPQSLEQPYVRRFKFVDEDTIELKPIESENILTWKRLT